MLHDARATLRAIRVEPDATGRPAAAFADLTLHGVRGSAPRGFAFTAYPDPLVPGARYTLDEDPNMRGSVRVTATIAPNGEVRGVSPAASGLSSTMVACVTRVVRGAQFSAPEGGGATLVIPMTFIPQ